MKIEKADQSGTTSLEMLMQEVRELPCACVHKYSFLDPACDKCCDLTEIVSLTSTESHVSSVEYHVKFILSFVHRSALGTHFTFVCLVGFRRPQDSTECYGFAMILHRLCQFSKHRSPLNTVTVNLRTDH